MMANCTKCGAKIQEGAKFCTNCGQEISDTPKEKKTLESILDTPEIPMEEKDVSANKVMAVLSYFGLLVLIPILAAKNSPYARFHANQGLILLIASFLAKIVSEALDLIPVAGILLGGALELLSFAYLILGVVNACTGKAKELPIIGKFKILS